MKRNILRYCGLLVAVFVCARAAYGQKGGGWQEATGDAVQRSKITLPGSVPFRLKASIAEVNKKDPRYKAEIEEIWVAPDKWRRTIKSAGFSQTLIVNGGKVYEQNTGDFYPFWLSNLVIAMFDVAPAGFSVGGGDKKKAEADPDPLKVPLDTGRGSPVEFGNVRSCFKWSEQVGAQAAQNLVFSTVCLMGEGRLLGSVITPSFHVEFDDYRTFQNKQVARRISIAPENDVRVEARITELRELNSPDEASFSIEQPTPERDRVHSVRLTEDVALKLLETPAQIRWAPVREGRTSGAFSLMVYVDKQGKVREVWPLNADSPFPQQQAIKEVMQWRFKPANGDGSPTQMETLLSFHFDTKVENPIPLLSNAEGRKLAIVKAEPHFTQARFKKGTAFTVRITLDERGRLISVDNYYHIDTLLFAGAENALSLWQFKPYKIQGKPERCNADITFHVD